MVSIFPVDGPTPMHVGAVLWEFGGRRKRGRGKKEGRRRKINMKLGRGHEVGGGILRDLEMGSGHGSGQNAKSSKDKLKIF